MLADGIRAETLRLSRNATVLFWSVVFLPVFGLVMSVLGNVLMKTSAAKITLNGRAPPELAQMMMGGPVRLVEEVVSGVADMANPAVLLFLLIGAATLYAGDYRWETWRLISARNSRINLLLGKVGAFGLLALAAMIALLAGEIAETVLKAVILNRPLSLEVGANVGGRFLGGFVLSWLALMQFTLIGLLAAVTTRSLLATVIIPIVVGVAQLLSPQTLALLGLAPDGWIATLANPGAAFVYLRAAVEGGDMARGLSGQHAAMGLVSVAFWIAWPLAAALWRFQRQDLAKE
ncbi:MAG: hypothetical protein KF910_00920 [Brevundimonas sp.]|uniref:hypothetical protein n=1 Tax=Brevundimonas sp. TaxID=1871086 RepID=UPI0025C3ECE3|nr:hypothetical protein [Brevundimonas sp.]MBX3476150.1 hypothetical protein [Brevundimonas sp.]